MEPITPPAKHGRRSSEGADGEGQEGEPAAPEGYWQENACLPLRCDPATGSWGLPVVMVEEILFGLTAEDYTKLDYAVSERPPHHVDYRDSTGEDGVEGTRQAAGWRSEPETQILVSARREIGCWSAAGAELEHALVAVAAPRARLCDDPRPAEPAAARMEEELPQDSGAFDASKKGRPGGRACLLLLVRVCRADLGVGVRRGCAAESLLRLGTRAGVCST